MTKGLLEHVNMTVSDPDKTAQMLCNLFGWHIRWSGDSIHKGRTVHVGTDTHYVAVYSRDGTIAAQADDSYRHIGAVNHLGILVDDLAAAEKRVLNFGIKTHSHQVYEPGARFYFHDDDNIEYEVVSYA